MRVVGQAPESNHIQVMLAAWNPLSRMARQMRVWRTKLLSMRIAAIGVKGIANTHAMEPIQSVRTSISVTTVSITAISTTIFSLVARLLKPLKPSGGHRNGNNLCQTVY